MVDTVRFTQRYELKKCLPIGWKRRWKEFSYNAYPSRGQQSNTRGFNHLETGLSVRLLKDKPASIEFSLARVLFGTNARLITSSDELEEALLKAAEILNDIAKPVSNEKNFSRLDLVWQFKGKIHDYIIAHQSLKHPKIDRAAWIWQGETILWVGKEMSICIYGKSVLVSKKHDGEFVRAEIRLSGKKLKEKLGDGSALKSLSFDRCYKFYREQMIMFSPLPLPETSAKITKDEILRLALENKWMLNKQPAFDFLTKDYSDKRRKEKNLLTSKTRLKSYQINWRENLPPQKPSRVIRGSVGDFSIRPFYFTFKRIIGKISKTLNSKTDS